MGGGVAGTGRGSLCSYRRVRQHHQQTCSVYNNDSTEPSCSHDNSATHMGFRFHLQLPGAQWPGTVRGCSPPVGRHGSRRTNVVPAQAGRHFFLGLALQGCKLLRGRPFVECAPDLRPASFARRICRVRGCEEGQYDIRCCASVNCLRLAQTIFLHKIRCIIVRNNPRYSSRVADGHHYHARASGFVMEDGGAASDPM